MKRAKRVFLVLLLLLSACSTEIPRGFSAPATIFYVNKIGWGTSTSNPISVSPGDTNVPLTVDVRNNSTHTLTGIQATLHLRQGDPFTDSWDGDYEVSAIGLAQHPGLINVSQEFVYSFGYFSITFRLNIDPDAAADRYLYNMAITYVKQIGGNYSTGPSETLPVPILMANRAPTIDFYSPTTATPTVNLGDSLNFTCTCNDPDGDPLFYEWKLDGVAVSNRSWYIYSPGNGSVGVHTLAMRVSDGNLTATRTWTVTVDDSSQLVVLLSSNYLQGGIKNSFNIILRDNLWKGTVDVSLSIPSPIVVYGNTSWVFRSVELNASYTINVDVFVPVSSIKSTVTGTLTVTFNDIYGRSLTETKNLGFTVQGLLELDVYDLTLSPRPVHPGEDVTVTATILNRGNVNALFMNASILPNPYLSLRTGSHTYIGAVESDSPAPFTLVGKVGSDVENGTYMIHVRIYYRDDQYQWHTIDREAEMEVILKTEGSSSDGEQNSLIKFFLQGGWAILVVVATVAMVSLLYYRRLHQSG